LRGGFELNSDTLPRILSCFFNHDALGELDTEATVPAPHLNEFYSVPVTDLFNFHNGFLSGWLVNDLQDRLVFGKGPLDLGVWPGSVNAAEIGAAFPAGS
jgi:hypothetical protein